jgi:hypothetical protein
MHAVIESLRKEVQIHDKPENKINIQRFFKEKLDNPYSLRGAIFKKISQKCFKEVRTRFLTSVMTFSRQT